MGHTAFLHERVEQLLPIPRWFLWQASTLGGEKTWQLVYPLDPEPDIAVQLFGSNPNSFVRRSQIAERLGPKLALIDINMACPVPKVVKKGRIGFSTIPFVRRRLYVRISEVDVPVTAKIRRGRTVGSECAPSSRELGSGGAAAVILLR